MKKIKKVLAGTIVSGSLLTMIGCSFPNNASPENSIDDTITPNENLKQTKASENGTDFTKLVPEGTVVSKGELIALYYNSNGRLVSLHADCSGKIHFLQTISTVYAGSILFEIDTTNFDLFYVVAPVSGTFLRIVKQKGESVSQGDLICIIESMKMELEIKAGKSGIIENFLVNEGDEIQDGQILAVIRSNY